MMGVEEGDAVDMKPSCTSRKADAPKSQFRIRNRARFNIDSDISLFPGLNVNQLHFL